MTPNQKFAVILIICGVTLFIAAGCCFMSQVYLSNYWVWLNSWTENLIP